ncbi:MAG: hypothetical protein WKG06_31560 [Segetibacter sp.]
MFVSSGGGAGKTSGVCFKTGVVCIDKSLCGLTVWLIGVRSFTKALVSFFSIVFGLRWRFTTTGVLGAVTTTGVGFTHSRKVISSKAKSFPHPPVHY